MLDQDLLTLVGRHTALSGRPVASTKGGEYKGPCPMCGGKDRFSVWPNHPSGRPQWWCKGCGKQGDGIAFLVEVGEITPQEAGRLRHGGTLGTLTAAPKPPTPGPRHPGQLAPPGPEWQRAGRAFVAECEAALWDETGEKALAWLRGRGLTDETIRAAHLGYNEKDRRQSRQRWGMGKGKSIWLPRGIVIPWDIGPDLWRVNIRRPSGDPKYIGPAGCKNGLYNADALATDKAAALVEGEIDALTLGQEAGDLVVAVATGSTSGSRRPRWIARLAMCPQVLVSFDAEVGKGDKAAAWWVGILPNAKRWRPLWADANAMAQDGVDLRAWVLAAFDGGDPRPVASEPQQSTAETVATNKSQRTPTPTEIHQTTPAPDWLAEIGAALPVTLEDWPDLKAQLGARFPGLGFRLTWPAGEPGLTLEVTG